MTELRERVLLIGVELPEQQDFSYAMEELANLADACQLEAVGTLSQKAARPHPAHYLGSGKLEELKAQLEALDRPSVLFNDELSPAQIRNLEKLLPVRIIDRTMLILEIFAERAQTQEAQLQVEVARLHYMLPRLVGSRESLGRQGGGSGLKNRGAGETKLELDRRRIEERISVLEAELEKLVARRQVMRKQRRKQDMKTVSLVGYTNAGKSSLMNAMLANFNADTSKAVYARDMLFATLETKSRSIQLGGNRSFVLTDTVGFISRLPHHLVKAFRSTLEEVAEADLLLHVVDASSPQREQHQAVTRSTLEELSAGNIPILMVYNKSDLTEEQYPRVAEEGIYLSTLDEAGIRLLGEVLMARIFNDYGTFNVVIPYDKSEVAAYLNAHGDVQATEYEESGTRLLVSCRIADIEKHRSQLAFVEQIGPGGVR